MNGHFNKRGRNHQRRRQGINPNRALDSNGPDVRIRGTAQQIYDKYLTLARDATSSGDRVKAENYFQHAEHYFRVLRSIQGPQAAAVDPSQDGDFDGGEQPSIGEAREGREDRRPQPQFESSDSDADIAAGDQPPETPANGAGEPRGPEQRNFEQRAHELRGPDAPGRSGDFEGRRRRRRPRRHREDGGVSEAAEDAEPADA
jgi:hypothetical protein